MNQLLIRRRGMMGAQLHPIISYQRVEYLQSDGHQYVLLGLSREGYLDVDAVCLSTSSTTQVLACTTPNGAGGTWFGVPSGKDYWGLSTTILYDESYSTRIIASMRFAAERTIQVNINGVSNSRVGNVGVSHGKWALFASNNGSFGIAAKVFSCKCYNYSDHSLVGDLIPVRVGQVGYMYDRVRGQLFGNAGTGDFILGPDVQ